MSDDAKRIRWEQATAWPGIGASIVFLIAYSWTILQPRMSHAMYAALVSLLGLMGAATWGYAYRAGLLSPVIDPPLFRYILVNNLITPIVFMVSIPLAYILKAAVGPSASTWAMWLWVLSSVGAAAYGRIGGRIPAAPTAEQQIKD